MKEWFIIAGLAVLVLWYAIGVIVSRAGAGGPGVGYRWSDALLWPVKKLIYIVSPKPTIS